MVDFVKEPAAAAAADDEGAPADQQQQQQQQQQEEEEDDSKGWMGNDEKVEINFATSADEVVRKEARVAGF